MNRDPADVNEGGFRHKLAEWFGKGESPALRKILQMVMTEEEARFLLDLPAPTSELAAKYGLDDVAIGAQLSIGVEN